MKNSKVLPFDRTKSIRHSEGSLGFRTQNGSERPHCDLAVAQVLKLDVTMRKSEKSKLKTYLPPEVPMLQKHLDAVRGELKSEIHSAKLELSSEIKARDCRFSSIDEKLHSFDAKFDNLQSQIGGFDGKFNSLQSQISGFDSKFNNLQSQISGFDAKFDKLQSQISGFDARFDSLQGQIYGLDAKITKLSADIHRVLILLEEQENRNRVVLDANNVNTMAIEQIREDIVCLEKIVLPKSSFPK